jgi:hypothetical protein
MLDHPVIDPRKVSVIRLSLRLQIINFGSWIRYFSNERDLKVLIKATRLALRIARTEPLASALDLPKDSKDQSTFFWPGDASPDTVRPVSVHLHLLTRARDLRLSAVRR